MTPFKIKITVRNYQGCRSHSRRLSLTTAGLYSAVIHDQDNNIPRKAKILDEIEKVMVMLKYFNMGSKTFSLIDEREGFQFLDLKLYYFCTMTP